MYSVNVSSTSNSNNTLNNRFSTSVHEFCNERRILLGTSIRAILFWTESWKIEDYATCSELQSRSYRIFLFAVDSDSPLVLGQVDSHAE